MRGVAAALLLALALAALDDAPPPALRGADGIAPRPGDGSALGEAAAATPAPVPDAVHGAVAVAANGTAEKGTEFGRACGLYDVAMLCSESNRGCIVLAHNMRFKSCFVYCAVSGLWCRDGWEDADDNCVAESRVGCWSRRDTADVICWCEALFARSPLESYQRFYMTNCYAGHGALERDGDALLVDSPAECAPICDQDELCDGFVYIFSQRKCWRRLGIHLPACEQGQPGLESSEFATFVKHGRGL